MTHGQSPVRHRRTLLQSPEGSYGNQLSRVALFLGSGPLHHSGAFRNSDHVPIGIGDHFVRNTHKDGLKKTISMCSLSSLAVNLNLSHTLLLA